MLHQLLRSQAKAKKSLQGQEFPGRLLNTSKVEKSHQGQEVLQSLESTRMKPESNTNKKCGSKRRKHQCGIGICSKVIDSVDEEEEFGNEKSTKRQKFKEAAEKIKEAFPEKRLCKKCGRPIKGHPIPRGRGCILIPLSNIEDIQMQKENSRLDKGR